MLFFFFISINPLETMPVKVFFKLTTLVFLVPALIACSCYPLLKGKFQIDVVYWSISIFIRLFLQFMIFPIQSPIALASSSNLYRFCLFSHTSLHLWNSFKPKFCLSTLQMNFSELIKFPLYWNFLILYFVASKSLWDYLLCKLCAITF